MFLRKLQTVHAFVVERAGGGAKGALLGLVGAEGLRRGLGASEAQAAAIEAAARACEALNPTPRPLESPELLSGRWRLVYTTSDSILGRSRPFFLRPRGPIYQTIDAANLKLKNQEGWPTRTAVLADLEPSSPSEVAVQFRTFLLGGLLPVPAPARARGALDTTFLDAELRIGRGDKGNLFVLVQDDPAGRP